MAKAKQPVRINNLEFDALIEEERILEAVIPEYATEDGFSITDAIILNPETLSMVLYVTNTPVTWHEKHGNDSDRVNKVCNQLEEMYYSKTPVTISTTDRTYTDMAITNLSLKKSIESGYSREIPISFKKVRQTTTNTTTIPDSYGKSGSTGASAGTANTSSGSTDGGSSSSGGGSSSNSSESSGGNDKSSILYGVASNLFK